MTSSCTSFIFITKDLCKPRRSLCITSMQLIELYNSMMQLHKFLPNRPTKQDLINAGCQINAGVVIYCTNSVICGISCWSGVLFTVMCVRTQKFLSYASSAIFRTCYLLSVRRNCLTYVQPSRYLWSELGVMNKAILKERWLLTDRRTQGYSGHHTSIASHGKRSIKPATMLTASECE